MDEKHQDSKVSEISLVLQVISFNEDVKRTLSRNLNIPWNQLSNKFAEVIARFAQAVESDNDFRLLADLHRTYAKVQDLAYPQRITHKNYLNALIAYKRIKSGKLHDSDIEIIAETISKILERLETANNLLAFNEALEVLKWLKDNTLTSLIKNLGGPAYNELLGKMGFGVRIDALEKKAHAVIEADRKKKAEEDAAAKEAFAKIVQTHEVKGDLKDAKVAVALDIISIRKIIEEIKKINNPRLSLELHQQAVKIISDMPKANKDAIRACVQMYASLAAAVREDYPDFLEYHLQISEQALNLFMSIPTEHRYSQDSATLFNLVNSLGKGISTASSDNIKRHFAHIINSFYANYIPTLPQILLTAHSPLFSTALERVDEIGSPLCGAISFLNTIATKSEGDYRLLMESWRNAYALAMRSAISLKPIVAMRQILFCEEKIVNNTANDLKNYALDWYAYALQNQNQNKQEYLRALSGTLSIYENIPERARTDEIRKIAEECVKILRENSSARTVAPPTRLT